MDNPPRNSPGKAIDLEKKGDLMIWDLWARGIDCNLYMLVLNTYAAYYSHNPPEKSLAMVEKDNECKYLDSYLHQRRHFSLFFISVDVLLDT